MKLNIFALLSTCMDVVVSLFYLFVHEPPYKVIVFCCNPVFSHRLLHMDHDIAFHIRMGFTQNCLNNSQALNEIDNK